MTEQGAAAVLALLALGLLLLMRRGWVRRRDAGDVPAPPAVPGDDALGRTLGGPVDAVYVSTTRATSSFDRVVPHGLGVRSPALVRVHERGVVVDRTGAPDLFVPADALTAVGTAPGMAGKVVGGDGLVVVEWRLGDLAVRTGLLTRRRADREPLLGALRALAPGGPGAPAPDQPATPRTEDKP